jgi:hypothetical protein
VIVHDGGDVWQVVLQTHHADLSAQFAQAWGNGEFATPERRDSMITAARRHDDGWAVWERSPRLAEGDRPLPFLEVHITSHLAFYTAAIVDVTDEDPYAGLLVAMHGAGLYRGRYGTQPGLRNKWADSHRDEIEGFVAQHEGSYPGLYAQTGAQDGPELWADYKLLQAFDRLSLYFSGLFPTQMGQTHEIAPVPTDRGGGEATLALDPVTEFGPLSPRHVRMDPYPFGEKPARFTLKRHVIDKSDCSPETVAAILLEREPEEVELVIE